MINLVVDDLEVTLKQVVAGGAALVGEAGGGREVASKQAAR